MDDLDLGTTIKGFSSGQKVFNRYTLRKILGRGGMGVVWLAHDGELDREVALKFLPEIVALDREAVADLKRETRRNLDLTHVNIVRIYDFVSDERTAAISMEYIAGVSLAGRKLDKPDRVFTAAELAPWVEQLCVALAYAHGDAQVVHRDLKPANLMIDARGRLKITDFGIARGISDSVSRVSAQAGSSGTPLYMSPQQMMGEKPAVTDDIYALGATLYELLTSKPPFYTGNVILQVREKPVPSLADRRKELGIGGEPVPPAWEVAIAACLAKEPADRPQGAMELWRRLSAAPAGQRTEPAQAAADRPPSPIPEPTTVSAGWRRSVLPLAGSALMLAALGTALLFTWRLANNNYDVSQWWSAAWWMVEYGGLTGWITASIALVRWKAGRDFSWRPWVAAGLAMVLVNVAYSEICNRLIEHDRQLNEAMGIPPLMGLVLAGVGLACFRKVRPITLPRLVRDLWLGLVGGAVAVFLARVPLIPEPAASNYLIKVSYPTWVVMGLVAWFSLLRFAIGPIGPGAAAPAKPGRWSNVLAVTAALLLGAVVFYLMNKTDWPGILS